MLIIFPLYRSHAAEFRVIMPILTPKAIPEGAAPVKAIRPIPRKIVTAAVNKLVRAWNSNALQQALGKEFYDKSRLTDAMDTKVPRDAKMRVLSIQGIQTLNQFTQTDPEGNTILVSTVSATVRTQLEFNDSVNGFQRREGTNEYIFRVRQRMSQIFFPPLPAQAEEELKKGFNTVDNALAPFHITLDNTIRSDYYDVGGDKTSSPYRLRIFILITSSV